MEEPESLEMVRDSAGSSIPALLPPEVEYGDDLSAGVTGCSKEKLGVELFTFDGEGRGRTTFRDCERPAIQFSEGKTGKVVWLPLDVKGSCEPRSVEVTGLAVEVKPAVRLFLGYHP